MDGGLWWFRYPVFVGAFVSCFILFERVLLFSSVVFLLVVSDRCCGGYVLASESPMGAQAGWWYFSFDRPCNYHGDDCMGQPSGRLLRSQCSCDCFTCFVVVANA